MLWRWNISEWWSWYVYQLAEGDCRRNMLDVKKMRDQSVEQLNTWDNKAWDKQRLVFQMPLPWMNYWGWGLDTLIKSERRWPSQRLIKFDLIKIKNFCSSKNTLRHEKASHRQGHGKYNTYIEGRKQIQNTHRVYTYQWNITQ